MSQGICEICGHYVAIRQKGHIVGEERSSKENILMLCPSCHIMFDTQLKVKLRKALSNAGALNLPASWKKGIYEQAAEASAKTRGEKR